MKELINEEKIRDALKNRIIGIKDYLDLMENLHKCDVSKNEEFIKKYRNFYKMNMARLPEDFYNIYFGYLEENKHNNKLLFKDILTFLFHTTKLNRVEASFSSKLLATVNANMPVWDKNVLSQLEIKEPKSRKNDKLQQLEETIKVYDELTNKLNKEYLKAKIGRAYVHIFNETFKNDFDVTKITPIKKIDFVLWSLGEKSKTKEF